MTMKETLDTLKQVARSLEDLAEKERLRSDFELELKELEEAAATVRSIRRRIKSRLKDEKS